MKNMSKEAKRRKLIKILSSLPVEIQKKLQTLKRENKSLDRSDFIWHFLLQSFSTMGNSKGYFGLIQNKINYNRASFDSLSKISSEERNKELENILRDAKVRMPGKKANWLAQNFDLINEMGGLKQARRKALECVGTGGKINFLKQFAGIGDKYGRNIWMDVYHPDFYNSIAIDIRIKKITRALGYTFTKYGEEEQFYLEIAKEANLQGWELDRILYNFSDDLLSKLQQ